jgi:putative hydrolase of the HAD superfamily
VLFDFGGTLDADGVPWSPRFHAAYRAIGGGLEFAAFDSFFQISDEALGRLPGIGALGFRATIEAAARLVVELLPDNVDAGALARRLHAEALDLVARNVPILERLARRYRLGVVSNFTGNLRPCLEELGLARFFSVLSDSTLVGWSKPDPRIFAHTLAALQVSPQHAWMVGDNFDADMRGAAGLGIRTCWLAPSERTAPTGAERVPTARIRRLPDVEAVLK